MVKRNFKLTLVSICAVIIILLAIVGKIGSISGYQIGELDSHAMSLVYKYILF